MMTDENKQNTEAQRSLLLIVQGMRCLMAFDSYGYFYSHQDLSSYLLGEHKKDELKRMAEHLNVARINVAEKADLRTAFRKSAQQGSSFKEFLNKSGEAQILEVFDFNEQAFSTNFWQEPSTVSDDNEPDLESAQRRYEELKSQSSQKAQNKADYRLFRSFLKPFKKKRNQQDQSSS
jgi:hypothetical protein